MARLREAAPPGHGAPPASLAAMWRSPPGGWTEPEDWPAGGDWWYRLVSLPVCLVTHYLAWLVARPSRTFTAAVVALVVWQALR